MTVKISNSDISGIKKLGHEEVDFVERDSFLQSQNKKILRKKKNGWCVFLQRNKKGIYSCKIYEHRPEVCRRYPFFKHNIGKVESCLPQFVNVQFKKPSE